MAITRLGPNQSVNLASNVTGTLPAANGGSGRTAVTGNVLQVVSTSAADDLVTTSTSYVDINLSLNITPSATSSKIFLSYNGNNENNGSSGNKLSLQMLRDSTQIADATGIGSLGSENGIVTTASLSVLDSPSTTSQITYKMQGKSDDGTVMVFNVNNDLGTITAYEIAG
tara:strand:+ start:916 stop:1425 length:510 start_codon:yes stop_codon:yes gene_type:complete